MSDGRPPSEAGKEALDARLVDLEIRVAFQEKLLGDLDDVIRALRDELDELRAAHQDLEAQLQPSSFETVDEKPPHY